MSRLSKHHLLKLLKQDKLVELINALLEGDLSLPRAAASRLEALQQDEEGLPATGEARQRLTSYLRDLIEELFPEPRQTERPSPLSRPAAKPRGAGPSRKKGGSLFQRAADQLGGLFGGRSASRRSKSADRDASPPPSPRIIRPPSQPANRPAAKPSSAKPPIKVQPTSTPKLPPLPVPQAVESPSPAAPEPSQSPFQRGKLLYVLPPQMPLETVSTCRIRIAPDELRDLDLKAGLSKEELANAQSEGIRMTQVMRVELLNHPTDTDNFRISCRNNLEQPVFPFTVSEWVFDVVPQRPGKYALLIRVTAKINYAGAERSFDLVVLNRAVEVTAGAGEVVELAESTQPIPDNDWDEADVKFVDQALQNNQIARAIERLANFIQDKDRELHLALLLQQARWNDNSNKLEQGRIATADWDLMNNQVRYAIAQFHQQIQTLDFERDQSTALAAAREKLSS